MHYLQDTKDKASGSSTVPVIANSTLINQIHTAARHPTFTIVSLPYACACLVKLYVLAGTVVLDPDNPQPMLYADMLLVLTYFLHHQAVMGLHASLIMQEHLCCTATCCVAA